MTLLCRIHYAAIAKEAAMPDGHSTVVTTEDREMLETFLSKLTDISRQTGIAIAQPSDLFVMEPEDYAFSYVCDADGRVSLG